MKRNTLEALSYVEKLTAEPVVKTYMSKITSWESYARSMIEVLGHCTEVIQDLREADKQRHEKIEILETRIKELEGKLEPFDDGSRKQTRSKQKKKFQ